MYPVYLEEWKIPTAVEGMYDFTFYLQGDQTGWRNDRGIYFCQLQAKFLNMLLSKLTPYAK
jgi:hypothetical protein